MISTEQRWEFIKERFKKKKRKHAFDQVTFKKKRKKKNTLSTMKKVRFKTKKRKKIRSRPLY